MASINLISHTQTNIRTRCYRETFLFDPRTHGDDILSSKNSFESVPFEFGIDMQRLSRHSTRRVVGSIVLFHAFA